jgi:hypothetical protein
MEIEQAARLYALELLTTQLFADYFRTMADPAAQREWVRGKLHESADAQALGGMRPDEATRLRRRVKAELTRLLDTALAQAQATPLQPRDWSTGPQFGA